MVSIGEIYNTTKSGQLEIIGYNGMRDVTVKFLNTGNVKYNVLGQMIERGTVKDTGLVKERIEKEQQERDAKRLIPTVHGVGFMGIGEYDGRNSKREKALWRQMLRRAYSSLWHEQFPTYKGVTVCYRWHNFQNFCEDIKSLDGYWQWFDRVGDMQLDKDKLSAGNKVYGPETCCFITKHENSSMAFKEMHENGNFKGGHKGKGYKFIDPDGRLVTITNLKRFCEDNGLTYPTMNAVYHRRAGVVSHKGFRAVPTKEATT